MKKRILATVLCLCLVMGVIGVPFAQAKWSNTSSIALDMSLSSGTITSKGTVVGKTGTSDISVTYTLEKLVGGRYTHVDSWSASSSSMLSSKTNYTSNCTSGTYKLSISGTVTKDGYIEDIDDWFTKNL